MPIPPKSEKRKKIMDFTVRSRDKDNSGNSNNINKSSTDSGDEITKGIGG